MAKKTEWNYEATVAQIEQILGEIEDGDLELNDVFGQFSKAVESLHQCEKILAQQREQVELLLENLGDT